VNAIGGQPVPLTDGEVLRKIVESVLKGELISGHAFIIVRYKSTYRGELGTNYKAIDGRPSGYVGTRDEDAGVRAEGHVREGTGDTKLHNIVAGKSLINDTGIACFGLDSKDSTNAAADSCSKSAGTDNLSSGDGCTQSTRIDRRCRTGGSKRLQSMYQHWFVEDGVYNAHTNEQHSWPKH
jgi:hypothetical protein